MTRTLLRVGLTGSIGMGKSTTAAMFADLGLPVWDADAAVHRLYAKDGAGVDAVAELHPPAVRAGAVDRTILAAWIAADPRALARLEAAVHPLVAADRDAFIARTEGDMAIFDIPLLFETGLDAQMDRTVVVSAPPEVQRARVLTRPGMTLDRLNATLARQMPDAEKRIRADHVIVTTTMEGARAAVAAIVAELEKEAADA